MTWPSMCLDSQHQHIQALPVQKAESFFTDRNGHSIVKAVACVINITNLLWFKGRSRRCSSERQLQLLRGVREATALVLI